MKRNFLYNILPSLGKGMGMGLLLCVLCTACKGEYDDWAQPQHNEQEQPANVEMSVSVQAPASTIDIEALGEAEKVQVFVPVQVESNVDAQYVLTLSDDKGNSQDFQNAKDGYINRKDLEATIVKFFGKKQEERSLNGILTALYEKNGSVMKVVSEKFTVKILPAVPEMNYWIYGKQNNRDGEVKTLPLMPVSKVVQTVTTYFSGSLDTKLYSDDSFGVDVPFGASAGNNVKATSGEFKDGGGYICPTSAGWYTLTFNFATYQFSFTRLDNQSPTEYSAISVAGQAMEQVKTSGDKWKSHCWYVLDVNLTDGTPSFHATEAVDWTGKTVTAGTYDVYFNDITGESLFVLK